MKEWLSDAYWHWRNVFYFRFDSYNDNIDRLAFFEELNYGWYQMYIYPYDDWYNPTMSKIRRFWLGQNEFPSVLK
jgi:hypothetical protein